ncbi:MAG TPA: glycerophosphodiester phosphodiesterase family protein [Caldimonas sp.]|nr:glycerophosphodiester phosphodiesterase family protein [Caldimonas sp.]
MILLDPLARPVIGHRGNRAFAPENTIASFQEAVALGVDALEFDLRVSRDGELMVFHDATLERTTDASGALADRTAAELGRLDAGANFTPDGGCTFPWRGRGVTVSTFDEVVESLPPALPFIVELKTPAATELVRAAIARHRLAGRVIVAGFDPAATRPLRGAGFALGASTPDVARLVLPALLGRRLAAPPFEALCIPPRWNHIPVPIAAFARALRGSGTVIHVWTINDPAAAIALWNVGVQGILSDDPAAMLAARPAAGVA